MWLKTLVAVPGSLLLSLSLMINLAYLPAVPRDVYLFVGFVGGILVWAALLTMCYCVDGLRRPLLWGGPLVLVSLVVNSVFITGRL